jgi:hypothetical protein
MTKATTNRLPIEQNGRYNRATSHPAIRFWHPRMMNITELDALRTKLKDLRIEHRELDARITILEQEALVDHLDLRRLKKRKLLLKDMIVKLESELIPDLNA